MSTTKRDTSGRKKSDQTATERVGKADTAKVTTQETQVTVKGGTSPEEAEANATVEAPHNLEEAGPVKVVDANAYSQMADAEKTALIKQLNSDITANEGEQYKLSKDVAVLYFRLGSVLLAEEKQHGKWLKWLDDHGIEERRAQRAMQIARHYKSEADLRGKSLSKALAESSPKGKPESKRRKMISAMQTMRDKVEKWEEQLDELGESREPLVLAIERLIAELQALRELCSPEVVAG